MQQDLDGLASGKGSVDAAVVDGDGGLGVGLLWRGCQSRGLVGTVDHCCCCVCSCSRLVAAAAVVEAVATAAIGVVLISCFRSLFRRRCVALRCVAVSSLLLLGVVCSWSKDGRQLWAEAED